MSVREFFSTRFTFPGYTFLLFSISLIYTQLKLPYLTQNEFILASFVYLLTGAPLGFLISQAWYLYFFDLKKGNFYRGLSFKRPFVRERPRKYINYIKNLNIPGRGKITDNEAKIVVISDYFCRGSAGENKGLIEYVSRRWDLMNMMGSTAFAILFGFLTGLFIKNCYFKSSESPIFTICGCKVMLDWIIVIVGIIFIVVLTWSRDRIENEHEEMLYIMLKNNLEKNNLSNLFRIFDETFFEKATQSSKITEN